MSISSSPQASPLRLPEEKVELGSFIRWHFSWKVKVLHQNADVACVVIAKPPRSPFSPSGNGRVSRGGPSDERPRALRAPRPATCRWKGQLSQGPGKYTANCVQDTWKAWSSQVLPDFRSILFKKEGHHPKLVERERPRERERETVCVRVAAVGTCKRDAGLIKEPGKNSQICSRWHIDDDSAKIT